MKKLIRLTIKTLLAAALIMVSCDFPHGMGNREESLTVVLPGGDRNGGNMARSVLSNDFTPTLRYRIMLTGPGKIIEREAAGGSVTVSVTPGEWTITVHAYDSVNALVGTGIKTTTIVPGKPASVSINMIVDPVYEAGLAAVYIHNETELRRIGTDFAIDGSINFYLESDIILTQPWTPIGVSSTVPFKALFDGQGHTLTMGGLDPAALTSLDLGLFGYADGAEIKNLGVIWNTGGPSTPIPLVALPADPVKTIGGIAGTLDNASTVKNVSVRGALCFAQTGGGDGLSLGGIAGLITAGSAIQDSASGVVIQGTSTSTTSVGGVAGGNEGGSISRCYAYGNVSSMTSASAYAGGIAGYNNGAISNCAALNSEMYNYDTSLALQGRAAGFNDTGGTLANNYAYDLMKVANYPAVIPSTDRTSNSKHGADILTTTLSSSGSTTQWTGDPTQLNWPAFQPGPSAGEPAGSPWHWGKTIVIPSNANPGTGVSPAYVPALWFE